MIDLVTAIVAEAKLRRSEPCWDEMYVPTETEPPALPLAGSTLQVGAGGGDDATLRPRGELGRAWTSTLPAVAKQSTVRRAP